MIPDGYNSTALTPTDPQSATYLRRLGGAFVALMGCWVVLGCAEPQPTVAPTTLPVVISDRKFDVELALTPQSRFQGLSDRTEVPPNSGMLFVMPLSEVQVFVMRRCLVPIDIIFLDPAGRVVTTHAMQVEPYDQPENQLKLYSSTWPAQFAIELKGGTLRTLELKLGQKIDLPVDDLKRWAS